MTNQSTEGIFMSEQPRVLRKPRRRLTSIDWVSVGLAVAAILFTAALAWSMTLPTPQPTPLGVR